MNHSIVTLSTAICATLASVPAQGDAPTPPKELAAYAPLLGTFTGKGSAHSGPDDKEPMQWTAEVHTRKVLGGFWIRSDTFIQLRGVPTPLAFRTYYGFDTNLKRHVAFSVTNKGDIQSARVHFAGKRMVTVEDTVVGPQRMVEQWTTDFAANGSMRLHGIQSLNGSKFFTHVDGIYVPSQEKRKAPRVVNASFSMPGMPEIPNQISKLSGFLGTYKFQGGMRMPGAPEMPIQGTMTSTKVLGGHVIETAYHGDPSPIGKYESWGVSGWNADEKCFVHIHCDNMGGHEVAKSRFVGKDLVVVSTAPADGNVPAANRTVIRFGKDGKIQSEARHATIGTAAPAKVFYLNYESK